jgi:hypothetical protein
MTPEEEVVTPELNVQRETLFNFLSSQLSPVQNVQRETSLGFLAKHLSNCEPVLNLQKKNFIDFLDNHPSLKSVTCMTGEQNCSSNHITSE